MLHLAVWFARVGAELGWNNFSEISLRYLRFFSLSHVTLVCIAASLVPSRRGGLSCRLRVRRAL